MTAKPQEEKLTLERKSHHSNDDDDTRSITTKQSVDDFVFCVDEKQMRKPYPNSKTATENFYETEVPNIESSKIRNDASGSENDISDSAYKMANRKGVKA
jgi:hypothetical protein